MNEYEVIKMKFTKNDIFYSVVRTNDVMSDGTPIFSFSAWNSKGQMIDAGEIKANSFKEAKDRILGV